MSTFTYSFMKLYGLFGTQIYMITTFNYINYIHINYIYLYSK